MNWALKETITWKIEFENKVCAYKNKIEWSRPKAQETYKKLKNYIYSERITLDRKLEKLERINQIWTGQEQ